MSQFCNHGFKFYKRYPTFALACVEPTVQDGEKFGPFFLLKPHCFVFPIKLETKECFEKGVLSLTLRSFFSWEAIVDPHHHCCCNMLQLCSRDGDDQAHKVVIVDLKAISTMLGPVQGFW